MTKKQPNNTENEKEKNIKKQAHKNVVGDLIFSFLDAITHGIPAYIYGLIREPKQVLKYTFTIMIPLAILVAIFLFIFN